MSFKGVRIPLVVGIAAIIFALLATGSVLYERANALTPLREALSDHPYVAEYKIERDDLWAINVTLHPVDRLKAARHEIKMVLMDILEPDSFELVIEGEPDDVLLRWWDRVELTVYEAAATGEFSRIVTAADESRPSQQQARVHVQADSEYIYIQMSTEQGHLYRQIYHGLNEKREEGQ